MTLEEMNQRIVNDCAGMHSVVELGAGDGRFIGSLTHGRRMAVELYEPYIEHMQATYPNLVVFQADAREWIAERSENSVDAVLAINLVEHMTHDDGERLITNCLRVAKRVAIIYTPNGLQPQHPTEVLPEHGQNPLQEHVSGWYVDELLRFGLIVEPVTIDANERGGLYGVKVTGYA